MRTVIISTLLLAATSARTQTFSEWFRQNKTQLKYLSLQIAALKANAITTEEGNRIAATGTQAISTTSHADYDVHRSYIQSLSIVNPAFRRLISPAIYTKTDWLRTLTTDGALQLRDDQRLNAILNIKDQMH